MRNQSTSSQNTLQALFGAPFFRVNFMKHLTVVYSIVDEAAFATEMNRVMSIYSDLGEKLWGITAVSIDHEIKRLQLVEQALNKNDVDIIPAILAHTDIGNVRDINEL